MKPNTEQRIDEYLVGLETAGPTPVCELTAINNLLDVLNIPRTYPDSQIPNTTRERVNMLVQYCVARGIEWHYTDEVF